MSFDVVALSLLLAFAGSGPGHGAHRDHVPVSSTSHGPPMEDTDEAWDAYAKSMTAYARKLAASSDPQRQFAAASLYPQLPAPIVLQEGQPPLLPGDVMDWVEKARLSGAKDSVIAWVDAMQCPSISRTCDWHVLGAHLVDVDPDNEAAHLVAAHLAYWHGDAETGREELRRAAQSSTYVAPTVVTLPMWQNALRDWIPPEERQKNEEDDATCRKHSDLCTALSRDLVAQRYASAFHASDYDPQIGCDSRHLTGDQALLQDCIAIYRRIAERDTTYDGQNRALTALVQLGGSESDTTQWRERLRRFCWMAMQWNRSGPAQGKARLAWQREWLDAIWRDGEVAGSRAMLAKRGIALDPPADWLPDDPSLRSLIQTGHYPR